MGVDIFRNGTDRFACRFIGVFADIIRAESHALPYSENIHHKNAEVGMHHKVIAVVTVGYLIYKAEKNSLAAFMLIAVRSKKHGAVFVSPCGTENSAQLRSCWIPQVSLYRILQRSSSAERLLCCISHGRLRGETAPCHRLPQNNPFRRR